MYKNVIFDLDGTLLNTLEDLAGAANWVCALHGWPVHTVEEFKYFVGNGAPKLLSRVVPDGVELTDELHRQLLEEFTQRYNAHKEDKTAPYPGIPELLEQLTSRGIAVAVASNKYQDAVEHLVNHFFPGIPWAAVEGQKEGVPVKPDPSIVFEILSKHPTPKSDVLYVGDSGIDMETARRACVESAGVTWGFRSVTELREHYADHIAESTGTLLRLAL